VQRGERVAQENFVQRRKAGEVVGKAGGAGAVEERVEAWLADIPVDRQDLQAGGGEGAGECDAERGFALARAGGGDGDDAPAAGGEAQAGAQSAQLLGVERERGFQGGLVRGFGLRQEGDAGQAKLGPDIAAGAE
jgi:hypothetical protein